MTFYFVIAIIELLEAITMNEVDVKKIEKGLLEQLKTMTLERADLERENDQCEISYDRAQKCIAEIEKSIKHASFLGQLNEKKEFDGYTDEEIENYIQLQIRRIAGFICVNDFVEVEEAKEKFLKSNVYQELCDKKTNYWKSSIEEIYIKYEQERLNQLKKEMKNNTEIISTIESMTQDTIGVLPNGYVDMVFNQKEQKKQV